MKVSEQKKRFCFVHELPTNFLLNFIILEFSKATFTRSGIVQVVVLYTTILFFK